MVNRIQSQRHRIERVGGWNLNAKFHGFK
jgi:hypothetical protein